MNHSLELFSSSSLAWSLEFALERKHASCPCPCLSFPWLSNICRTSHQYLCRHFCYFKHIRTVHMSRWSAIDMEYPLEFTRHHICLLMGICSSQYSRPRWGWVEDSSPSSRTHVLGYIRSGTGDCLGISTMVRCSLLGKLLQRSLSSAIQSKCLRILKHKILDRGWTKAHGYFIQMGGFVLYEGDVAKGVLDPGQFHKLLQAEKIRFPTITVEEIADRSKADAFSKTIAVGQTLWFILQCLARKAEHLDITLVELLTLSLAVLNGVMYFLWWHKPLDVRCPVRVELLGELDEPSAEAVNSKTANMDRLGEFYWSLGG